jgi:hypothetical protein
MSPLLGSSGGSSEYAFRGTLDDWPIDFAAALAAQNPTTPINPAIAVTATLTITGLNYKARVTVEHPNVTVAVISEFGVAVTDGREVYAARKESDPALLIRDQSVISIRLQPTSGTINDFLKTYSIPVKVGKRQGIWTVSTRAIDETPDSFTFNPLIDQLLNTTVISNTITIAGLETGFSFPISASANQVGSNISYFKNSTPLTGINTVANGDQIYLSTLTPNAYATPRTFTVQVGTFTTSWGILTRNAVTTVSPFSFTGISSANQLGFGYTSGFMTISGADPGPTSTDPATWPTDPTALLITRTGIGSFQILKSDGTLRYTDPANPGAPTYFQTSATYAFNGDKINLKVPSSTSYSTTTTTTLNVSDKSAAFDVTTRPQPIDTIPAAFAFTDLTGLNAQDRGVVVTSGPITLSGMIAGANGTASIPNSTAGVLPQFNINGSATWISPPTTANVQNGDIIRLRMTTPVTDPASGVTNNTITFRVNGTDTTVNNATPIDNPEGYTTTTGLEEDIWNVSTKARTCTPSALSFTNLIDRPLNTAETVTFTVGGYDPDCRMRVEVTSTSTNYSFTARSDGITIPAGSRILNNVPPGTQITLSVTTPPIPNYLTDVVSTITVTNNNTPDTITPEGSTSANWTIRTVANTEPASVTLSAVGPTSVELGGTFTLNWSTINCILRGTPGTVKSVSGPNWTTLPTSLNGSVTLTAPTIAGTYNYVMTVYANPDAINTPPLPSDATGIYATSNTIQITVVEDTSLVFTNSTTGIVLLPTDNFGSVSLAPLSTVTTSDSFIVSSYSPTIRGTIVAPTGVTASFNGGVTTRSFSPPGSPGDTVAARTFSINVTSSSFYTTTNTVDVVFDWLPPGAPAAVEIARKSFSVTTEDCIPLQTTGILTNGTTSSCTVYYYANVRWANGTQTTAQFTSDAMLYTPEGTTLKGLITTTGTGIAGTLAPTGPGIPGVDVTWRQYIDTIWDLYVTYCYRPPTQSEIESAFTTYPLNSATNLSAYSAQVYGGQIGILPGPVVIIPPSFQRNLTLGIPIYNSCDVPFYI